MREENSELREFVGTTGERGQGAEEDRGARVNGGDKGPEGSQGEPEGCRRLQSVTRAQRAQTGD